MVTIPPLSISGGAHTTVPSIIDFNTGTHNITTFMHLIKLRTDRHTPPKCLSLLVTRIKDEHFKILLNVDDVSQDWILFCPSLTAKVYDSRLTTLQ